ncbi:uncharacterized protein LOC143256707 [Tachypleus tridentatus]|uniref:uncharacterized protein LOC143256707 n=1 Tax=Tachypleus tridentatus TaxID=6853 RepID=UPI003FD0EBFB
MEKIILFCFITAFVGIMVSSETSDELYEDSLEEVIYRVPRSPRSGRHPGICRYRKSPWEDCNVATNTQRRTLTLKRGDPTCEQAKIVTRNCKKVCRYQKGEWSACDTGANTRTRLDTLKPGSETSCEQTRVITKKCLKHCRYDRSAEWSECDPVTNQKVKIKYLIQGDPNLCEATETVTKVCGRGGRRKNRGRKRGGRDENEDYE